MTAAMAMPEAKVSQSSRVMVMVTARPDGVCMAVMGMPVAIVTRVGRVAAVARIVRVIVAVVTESDGVISYVVDDSVDGEHRRTRRHKADEE